MATINIPNLVKIKATKLQKNDRVSALQVNLILIFLKHYRSQHTVWITKDFIGHALGNNREGRISGSIPLEIQK